MEQKIEVPTASPSLLMLNEYCLLDIFEFLNIDDSINLAKTCTWLRFVANRIFRKYSSFELDFWMVTKGQKYIDHLFHYIGQHVTFTSLRFTCRNPKAKIGDIVRKYSDKNVKKLKCTNRKNYLHGNVQPSLYNFDNVELLTLRQCYSDFTFYFTEHFFESFQKLKSVNIIQTFIELNELKTVFQNNQSIESFVYYDNGHDINCQLIELIPNVERLYLSGKGPISHILELNSLIKLNRLTKLRLDCGFNNINDFLRELATKGIIEEMHLEKVDTDNDFFDTLVSFSKLQLLVINGSNEVLKALIAWPTKLKKLRLCFCELTKNHLIEMIQQLEAIESIDVQMCSIVETENTHFKNVTKLSEVIRHIIDRSNRKQRLDINLPYCKEAKITELKYVVDSAQLRILHRSNIINSIGIDIHFPDCEIL